MDSSALTKSKRDRITSTSLNNKKSQVPLSTSALLSYKIGTKLLAYNKNTILEGCPCLPPFFDLSSFGFVDAVFLNDFFYIVGNFNQKTTLYLVNRTGPLQTSSVEPQITLTSSSFETGILAKYSVDGELQWVTQTDGIRLESITTDGIDLYIGGSQYQSGGSISDSVPNFGQPVSVMTFSLPGVIIAKYTTTGAAQWGTLIENNSSYLSNIECFGGELYVCNIFFGTVNFYNANGLNTPTLSPLLPLTSGPDINIDSNMLISKYDISGNAILRTHVGGNILNNYMSIDNGNIYITGSTGTQQGSNFATFYNSDDSSPMALTGGDVAFLARYATNGILKWATVFTTDGTSSDGDSLLSCRLRAKNDMIFLSVKLDNGGGIPGGFVSNFYYNATNTPQYDPPVLGFTLTEQSTRLNSTVFQYDLDGQIVWCSLVKATTLDPSTYNAVSITSLMDDNNGNLYAIGTFAGEITFFNPLNTSQMVLTSDGSERDILIIKYGPNGDLIWATKMSNNSNISGAYFLRNIDSSSFDIFGRFSDVNPKKIYQPDGTNAPILTNTFDSNQSAYMVKYTV